MDKEKRINLIYNIFSPATPVENVELFIGRTEQLEKIRQAIEERGQHMVMYGGRGVGKTSIANILPEFFSSILISKITCNSTDNYKSIWEKAVSKIQFVTSRKGIGFSANSEKRVRELYLPEKEFIDANDILNVFSNIENYVLIVIDEFDCVKDNQTKIMMADTLKSLSDNLPNVTVLIVGISENVNDLIGNHKSLERCLKQIQVPLMTREDTIELIQNSFSILELNVEEDVIDKIVEYSSGFPHYTHLLCKYATMQAAENEQNEVTIDNFDYAVEESIINSDYSIKEAYKKAISSYNDKNQFEDVIFASILADDAYNIFTPDQVLEKYQKLTNKETKKENLYYNLGMLCKPERGVILQKIGAAKNIKYKFQNPLMKAYVRLQFHNKL